MEKNSKFKTGANIFQRYFGKKKISSKRTKYWDKPFIGHKRNLFYENSNLRKDKEELLDEKEELLDENDDLFKKNKRLEDRKSGLIHTNNRLRDDIDKVNKKLSDKKEEYEDLKEKYEDLEEKYEDLKKECENLDKKNKNLSEQNNYMRDLLSCLGVSLSKDSKQIQFNTENQQMFIPCVYPFIGFNGPANNSLFNNINKSPVGQEQKPMPKISSQPLQKE